MKKHFFLALIISTNLFASFDPKIKRSAFKYIAGGNEATLGFRTHQKHGYDISLNHNFILEKDYSLKGYYLNYPLSDKNIFAYWGIGFGVAYWKKAPFRNGKYNEHPPKGIATITQRSHIINAVVVGYEFQMGETTKVFTQFELGSDLLFHSNPELFPALKIGTSF